MRPGLLLTWRKEFIPDALKNWDAIIVKDKAQLPTEFKNTRKQRFYTEYVLKYLSDWTGYCEETYFDVNCISVNEDTIITAGSEKENIKQIENTVLTLYNGSIVTDIFGMAVYTALHKIR